ncbi:MAG: peptidylprolyl isomerase [bacterium]
MRGAPLLVAVLLLAGCVGGTDHPTAPAQPLPSVTREAIRFDTTAGPIVVMLYPEAAPNTTALMKAYVGEGYYDGRAFYRTVPGHVIQVTNAAGGAVGEDARRVPLETDAGYHFSAGAAGIARDVDPNSGGPEIFIMDFATSHLDGNFSVWGQVVQGMDVVHAIARGPAVDAPRLPGGVPNPFPFDRMAVAPVTINATSLVKLTLSGEDAAAFPLDVARNVRVGDFRHSLQWPANLAAGKAAQLEWFVRPYNGAPVPGAESVRIRVDGRELAVGDGGAAGAYRFTWTPNSGGPHDLAMYVAGAPWATLQTIVQP